MSFKKFLFILLIFSVGCKSGTVQVTAINGANSDSPSQASLKTVIPSTSTHGTSVFFSSFSFYDANEVQKTGIAFLSDHASITSPYAFHFPVDLKTIQSSSVVPWENGLMYIKALDNNRDAVSFTRVPELETEELYSHSSHLISIAGSEDKNWLGWIDDKGSVFLWHGTTKNISELALPAFKAKSLQILSAANRILVTGDNLNSKNEPLPEVVLFDLSENPTGRFEMPAVDAQVSRNAKWIALTQMNNGQPTLIVSNLEKPDLKFQISTGIKGQSFQAKWSGDEELAYVVAKSSMEGDLRVASMTEKKSSLVSLIATGYPLSQIVCPSWRGTTLYFGSSSNEKLSILKAKIQSGQWRTTVFAAPNSTSNGYGCPNAERNNP